MKICLDFLRPLIWNYTENAEERVRVWLGRARGSAWGSPSINDAAENTEKKKKRFNASLRLGKKKQKLDLNKQISVFLFLFLYFFILFAF